MTPWPLICLLALSCSPSASPDLQPSPVCSSQEPCPLNCQDHCFSQAGALAATCMITLEGQFNPTRTGCSFADGSLVSFARPVPLQQDQLSDRSWHLTIDRQGQTCLELESIPLDWSQPTGHGQTVITTARGTYRQESWRTPLLTDGGAVVVGSGKDLAPASLPDGGPRDSAIDQSLSPEELQFILGCADGTVYELQDRQCQPLPTAQVLGAVGSSFSLSLGIGPQITPLFSCR